MNCKCPLSFRIHTHGFPQAMEGNTTNVTIVYHTFILLYSSIYGTLIHQSRSKIQGAHTNSGAVLENIISKFAFLIIRCFSVKFTWILLKLFQISHYLDIWVLNV
jgi:hypothetical protein